MNPENNTLSETADVALPRRNVLRQAAMAGAAFAALGLFAGTSARAATTITYADIPGSGDVKVLNYALALEALEADLYRQALYRLTTGGINQLGKYIPGLKLKTSSASVDYVSEFGKIEVEHRSFIDGALGKESLLKKRPFSRAVFDFNMQNLSASQVINLVYVAEKTGVTAYLGAVTKFQTKTYLQIAGAILGTEARHTAVIADIINDDYNGTLNVAPAYTDNNGRDKPASPDTVLAAVSPFIVFTG